MKFKELIKNEIFKLPKIQEQNIPFDKYIKEILSKYKDLVNQLDEDIHLKDIGTTENAEDIKKIQIGIIKGLNETIQEYYKGFPFKAYDSFSNTIRNDLKDLYDILKTYHKDKDNNLYRIRTKEDNFLFSRSEMFHIPFELRGKISTQRFSIPGFPSLYLGSTLYVCWEELNRPQIDSFQAVRLKNTHDLKLLDLTIPEITDETIYTRKTYRYFMTWPLIACCSVKVKNHLDVFKPEYIIPQLLLQWVRDNDNIDGIIYKSTHINQELYKQKNELTNIVIPVKKHSDEGHCEDLLSKFESTEAISWQTYTLSLGGQLNLHRAGELDNIDDKVPNFEIIKGRKNKYSSSFFGKLESILDSMETYPIEE